MPPETLAKMWSSDQSQEGGDDDEDGDEEDDDEEEEEPVKKAPSSASKEPASKKQKVRRTLKHGSMGVSGPWVCCAHSWSSCGTYLGSITCDLNGCRCHLARAKS